MNMAEYHNRLITAIKWAKKKKKCYKNIPKQLVLLTQRKRDICDWSKVSINFFFFFYWSFTPPFLGCTTFSESEIVGRKYGLCTSIVIKIIIVNEFQFSIIEIVFASLRFVMSFTIYKSTKKMANFVAFKKDYKLYAGS